MTPANEVCARLAGRLAVVHAAVLMVFLTWRFGGMDALGRTVGLWAALPAPFIMLVAWRHASPRRQRSFLRIFVPLLLFGALVVTSLFNPSMRLLQLWGEESLVPAPHVSWLPSSPFPAQTLENFALNLGFVLIALNLMLAPTPRSWLIALVAVSALNTAVLAAVGTLFKLTGATALLGRTPSPNPNFFATFVYHNHWGAVAILGAGAALALASHHQYRSARPLMRTSVPFWLLIAALILISVPLSSARASTGAAVVLASACAFFWLRRGQSPVRRTAGAGRRIGGLLALGGIAVAAIVLMLSGNTLKREFAQTSQQVADLRGGGIGDARLVIFRDTLELIRERPLFGWGWQGFQYVFPRVQSPLPKMQTNQPRMFVLDAHNDWLQLLAESGVIGAGLFVAILVGWIRWAGRGGWSMPPSRELVFALGAVALLALVDFPMACPAVVLSGACLLACAAALARQRSHNKSSKEIDAVSAEDTA